jgi:hypothetical protein
MMRLPIPMPKLKHTLHPAIAAHEFRPGFGGNQQ